MSNRIYIVLFFPILLVGQNLQSSEWVLNPSSIDASNLNNPYVAGEPLSGTVDLQVSEELSVNNVNNNFYWCIYAKLGTTNTSNNSTATIVASLGLWMPPNKIDPLTTNTPLELSYTDAPFISGHGTINRAEISYYLKDAAIPQSLNEQFQVIYTIQQGSCPTL